MTGAGLRETEHAVAPRPPRRTPPQPGRAGDPADAKDPHRRPRLARAALELGLFAALGAFGLAAWSRLVAEAPIGRLLGALAVATAGGAALLALGAWRPRSSTRTLLALAVAALATAAAMVVAGLPARLLVPPNWPELVDNLGRGLAGIEDTELPYDGGDVWLRLTLLLFVPLLLGGAVTLAFWPGRSGRPVSRVLSLIVLVAIYAVAATLDSPPSELLWGVPLLLLCVAWLWIPRLDPRRAAIGLAAALAAALAALPVAARLDPAGPWWDYETWDWFARDSEVRFEWDHSYGPYDWPAQGTTLLEVTSTTPLYWKASVLDRFDGFTWQRAQAADPLAAPERLARRQTPGSDLSERHPDWRVQASFDVRALSGALVIGAGVPQAVQGVDGVTGSADGTLRTGADPLRSGDSYSVLTYSPQPTAAELRDAPPSYPRRRFRHTTLVGLPATVGAIDDAGPTSSSAGPGAEAGGEGLDGGFAPSRARAMPLWGERPDPQLLAELSASQYGPTYRLARGLVADATTPYAAVSAIERHLSRYDYVQSVPQHTYPLASFLFEDRAGYCQHFAGTMALMLRMVGIPSRVVSGFAPGSLDEERDLYEVRDTDAHSWVEVYFRGIGWVTFDPTPAAAPAASQTLNAASGTFFRGRGAALAEQGRGRVEALERGLRGGTVGTVDGGAGPVTLIGLSLLAGATVALAAGGVVIIRRRRRLERGEAVGEQLAELRAALGRYGWGSPGDLTLLDVERRFATTGPEVADYAAGLRAHRFAPGGPAPPGASARRALRRALSGSGLTARLRGLRAIPPGGPRRSR